MAPDLEWFGDRVVANVLDAAVDATSAIVGDAMAEAEANTPVLTGELAQSVGQEGEGLDVRWGYHAKDEQDHERGLWTEIGANGKPGVYALRRAADDNYPRLAPRVARELGS